MLISKNSINKIGYLSQEIDFAIEVQRLKNNEEIFIIPIRLDESVPGQSEINKLNFIDLFPSYTRGFNRILSIIGFVAKEPIDYRDPVFPIGLRAPIDFEPFKDYGDFIKETLKLLPMSSSLLDRAHNYYIIFKTNTEGVNMPEYLLEKYPEEMIIVLQHIYHNLTFENTNFSIVLSFNSVYETITIPYLSVTEIVSSIGFRIHKVDENS